MDLTFDLLLTCRFCVCFCIYPATTWIYKDCHTLSLHDALPISMTASAVPARVALVSAASNNSTDSSSTGPAAAIRPGSAYVSSSSGTSSVFSGSGLTPCRSGTGRVSRWVRVTAVTSLDRYTFRLSTSPAAIINPRQDEGLLLPDRRSTSLNSSHQ